MAYIPVTVWNGWAENLVKTARKGSLVHVSGRLKEEKWEDKAGGGKRSKLVVVAESAIHVEQPRAGTKAEPEVSTVVANG